MKQAYIYDNATYVQVETTEDITRFRCEIYVDGKLSVTLEDVEAGSTQGAAIEAVNIAAKKIREKYAAISKKKQAINHLKQLRLL